LLFDRSPLLWIKLESFKTRLQIETANRSFLLCVRWEEDDGPTNQCPFKPKWSENAAIGGTSTSLFTVLDVFRAGQGYLSSHLKSSFSPRHGLSLLPFWRSPSSFQVSPLPHSFPPPSKSRETLFLHPFGNKHCFSPSIES